MPPKAALLRAKHARVGSKQEPTGEASEAGAQCLGRLQHQQGEQVTSLDGPGDPIACPHQSQEKTLLW